ncbi:MAG TPA: hypothetical protein VH640_22765 [Bryobacteraceae bacterium]
MAANPLIDANLKPNPNPKPDVNPKTISRQNTASQGSALARFLELRGRRIVKACGTLWYSVPGRFLMSLPYQAMLDPDPRELRSVICETRALGARFPSSTWSGLESGLYLMRLHGYSLDAVHPKHRPRVRRGLQCFEVRPATKAELLSQGRALNVGTMARQGRYDSEFGEPRRWATLVEAAFACSEISIPAVFDRSRLVAYMVTCREQGWLHILHQMSRQEDLSNFPNHVLTYVVTNQAAADPTLDSICYGYAPLFQAPGLHEYKLRFGYEMVPHRSAIQLHPAVSAALTCPVTLQAVRIARFVGRQNQWLETLQTVLKGARCSRPHGGLS